MFSFLKSKSTEPSQTSDKQSWGQRLKQGLKRTRNHFTDRLASAVLGKKNIDDDLLESLETTLLMADIGIETTQTVLANVTKTLGRKTLDNPAVITSAIKQELLNILTPYCQPLAINSAPFVILMVGVNGAGKTTSIAKIAHHFQQQGKSIMLAAGDTFRAAAVEQLQVWGERNQVPVIAQQSGADSASVIFDAMQSAESKNIDILIADTAGRLHTQSHLMAELAKIKRVMGKINDAAPHETMLIIDASMGQNALTQAQKFHEAIGLDSISLTKLDGTAKGGIIFAIANQLQLPIRFIGVGEQIDDLKPFDAHHFVDALFSQEDANT